MEHLVIISPKGTGFSNYLVSFPHVYKCQGESLNFDYFIYVGVFSPLQKVCQILSSHNFKEFSLDKETNYYRFKVHVE